MEHILQNLHEKVSDVDKHADIIHTKLEQMSQQISDTMREVHALRIETERQRTQIDTLYEAKGKFDQHIENFLKMQTDFQNTKNALSEVNCEMKKLHDKLTLLCGDLTTVHATLNDLPLKYEQLGKPLKLIDIIKLGPAFITVFTAIVVVIYYAIKHLGFGQ